MNPNQIILINKPYRWTSFDAVKKVKNVLTKKPAASFSDGKIAGQEFAVPKPKNFKVGHAGTLDPLATGLLIICTGTLTKNISEVQLAEKEYTGTFVIGQVTPSYDLETEISESKAFDHITDEQILKTAEKFTGKQFQTPPAHSAVKIKGVRAYEKARKGIELEIAPKEIEIKQFEITSIDLPYIYIRVVCSKGTYIRSLAHDFGKELGCGAYLSALTRTRIGNYLLSNALTIEQFCTQYSAESA